MESLKTVGFTSFKDKISREMKRVETSINPHYSRVDIFKRSLERLLWECKRFIRDLVKIHWSNQKKIASLENWRGAYATELKLQTMMSSFYPLTFAAADYFKKSFSHDGSIAKAIPPGVREKAEKLLAGAGGVVETLNEIEAEPRLSGKLDEKILRLARQTTKACSIVCGKAEVKTFEVGVTQRRADDIQRKNASIEDRPSAKNRISMATTGAQTDPSITKMGASVSEEESGADGSEEPKADPSEGKDVHEEGERRKTTRPHHVKAYSNLLRQFGTGKNMSTAALSNEIDDIYAELSTAEVQWPKQSLSEFVYDHTLRKFGLRGLSEKHLNDIIHSVHAFRSSGRLDAKVHLFGQFLGLYNMLPRDALDFYLYARKQVMSADGGTAMKFVEDAHEELEVVELHTAIDIAHRFGGDFYGAESQIAALVDVSEDADDSNSGRIAKSSIFKELTDACLSSALAGSSKESAARRKSSTKFQSAIQAIVAGNKLSMILGQSKVGSSGPQKRQSHRKSDVIVAYHGHIAVDDFLSKMLECYLIHRDRLEGLFRELFRAYDDNGDGVLSFAEFEVLLKQISPDVSDSFVHSIFRKAVGLSSSTIDGGNIDTKVFAASLHVFGLFQSFPDHTLSDVIANVEAQERKKKMGASFGEQSKGKKGKRARRKTMRHPGDSIKKEDKSWAFLHFAFEDLKKRSDERLSILRERCTCNSGDCSICSSAVKIEALRGQLEEELTLSRSSRQARLLFHKLVRHLDRVQQLQTLKRDDTRRARLQRRGSSVKVENIRSRLLHVPSSADLSDILAASRTPKSNGMRAFFG